MLENIKSLKILALFSNLFFIKKKKILLSFLVSGTTKVKKKSWFVTSADKFYSWDYFMSLKEKILALRAKIRKVLFLFFYYPNHIKRSFRLFSLKFTLLRTKAFYRGNTNAF